MSYMVRLEVFEGPFDLLLNLIERAELDIFDIPIAHITEEYLDYLRQMQELDLVVSGDFLVMAATLLQIKAKMLLPKKQCDDELMTEEDPREELVEKILEYKFFKEVAEDLETRSEQAASIFPRPINKDLEQNSPLFTNPVGEVDVNTLNQLYKQVLLAFKESRTVTNIERKISLAEGIATLRLTLLKHKKVYFSELLDTKERRFIIVVFLAVLELIRMREIDVVQKQEFGDILIISLSTSAKEEEK